ncbi:acyltransferase family protein [Amantichitinum ursilacus]|uniref:O-acetyltransferase OatA n=1 Tax=Amantichitinum ursilacus TaxID=857265 RepID=A0A0N1JSP2_9NEIS|nr:acyltransferase [Amantichitinum ursilacus]KPC52770.1 O-acetyltransferase OatA [Amantichitinum ursilacus]
MTASAHRNHGLDTLRAAAITLVFMYHYAVFVSHTNTFGVFSEIGWVGVDLFFVLSGYLIANQLLAGLVQGQRISFKAFYARRALRTLPVFWVTLALFFIFPDQLGGNPPPPLWRFLTFTQNWWLTPGTAFSHAWSLCVEEQFYLVLPLLLTLGVLLARRWPKRAAWWAWGVLLVAGIATRIYYWGEVGPDPRGFTYYKYIYFSTLCRADEFLPGVGVAMLRHLHPLLWQRITARGSRNLLLGVLATLVMLGLVHRAMYIEGYGYTFWMTALGYTGIAGAFALLVLAALSPSSLLARVRMPGAQRLALWSYSFYLIHKPVAWVVAQQLERWHPAEIVRLPVVTALCLLAGWLLHRAVEQPFMALRQKRVPAQFRLAPAAA